MTALVVHLGSINEGHYIGYVLVDPDKMFGPPEESQTTRDMSSLSLNDGPANMMSSVSSLKSRINGPDRRVWCFCSE